MSIAPHTPAIHELKTWPLYFEVVWTGEKTFELRRNDRGFRVGDWLRLREWVESDGYSGRTILAEIGYILIGFPGILPHDVVVMSIKVLGREGRKPDGSLDHSSKERDGTRS